MGVEYIHANDHDVVIKETGLCSGKGVYLPTTKEESIQILESLNSKYSNNKSEYEIIIEERIYGEEISLLAFCDGYTAKIMPPAQDYKRVYDNNEVIIN